MLSVYRDFGVVPREGREDNYNKPGADLGAYRVVHRGDLVLNKMKTWQGSLGISDYTGIVSPAYFVCSLATDVNHRFLHYLLRSKPYFAEYARRSKGIRPGQWDLPWEEFKSIHLALPPPGQQRTIADFLDSETSHIDALIAARRRMVNLLDERGRSIAERVVKQLRGTAPLVRLGHLVTELDERLGTSPPPPLLSVSIHHGVVPFEEANPDRMPRADALGNYKRCQPGDLVLNRMRAFQGGVGIATNSGIVSSDYAVLRPLPGAVPEYLHHLLRSPWFVGQMEARLRGIGSPELGTVRTPRINWEDLRLIRVPRPTETEQLDAARAIATDIAKTDSARDVIARQVDLLAERRQALVAAAVAGTLKL